MAKYTPKLYEFILQRMIDRVVARTDLSDLEDTSVVLHILAAVAREVDDSYHQSSNLLATFSLDTAAGADLVSRAAQVNPIALVKVEAVAATGTVVFSRTIVNPGPGAITIPSGTRVKVPGTDPLITFITTAPVDIAVAATDSAAAPSVAETKGTNGNVGGGTIVAFVGSPPGGVNSVSNPAAFVNGLGEEKDEPFRARIKAYIATLARSTNQSMEFAAASTTLASTGQRVLFSKAVESLVQYGLVTLYIDDGTGLAKTTDDTDGTPEILTSGPEFPGDVAQGGEEFLYTDNFPVDDLGAITMLRDATPLIRDDAGVNGYTLNVAAGQIFLRTALTAGQAVTMEYTWFTGLVAEVQKVIDGDTSDKVNYPGWRAGGVRVIVLTPSVVTQAIDLVITADTGYTKASLVQSVKDVIVDYVNSLNIGQDMILSEVVERVMGIPGMFDVSIVSPLANVPVLDDEIVRTADASVTVS